jgi:hypothetical protein
MEMKSRLFASKIAHLARYGRSDEGRGMRALIVSEVHWNWWAAQKLLREVRALNSLRFAPLQG